MARLDLLNLLVTSPGDLIFFLLVIALSQASFFMALGHRLRRPDHRGARRYTIATLGVVAVWVLLVAGALYEITLAQSAATILPPLERAASVITILLIGWALITADHTEWGSWPTVVLLVLIAVTLIGYVVTGIQWASVADQIDFNLHAFGLGWTLVPAVFSALGVFLSLVYVRIILDAPVKLVFFSLLLLGYTGTIIQMTQGDLIGNYAGLGRLALVGALPVLPIVIYRMVVGDLKADLAGQHRVAPSSRAITPSTIHPDPLLAQDAPQQSAANIVSPLERESVALLRALGLILENSTPDNIAERIVETAVDILRADVAAILRMQDANYADLATAYDKAMDRTISGMALNLDNQPTLVNAIERLAQRPLYVDRNGEELQDLYTRMDINQIGPAYFQPLTHGGELVAVLVVAAPYSKRELTGAEGELLKGIALISSSLLALSYAAKEASRLAEERAIHAVVHGVSPDEVEDDEVIAARQEMQASLQLARDQITQLSQQVLELKLQLDEERGKVANTLADTQEGRAVSERMLTLSQEHERLRGERDQLVSRLQESEAVLAGATAQDNASVFQSIIEVLQQEKADLIAHRESLQRQLDDLRTGDEAPVPEAMRTVLDRMTEEKARLEAERDQLKANLTDLQSELQALGIEGGSSGLAQLIGDLYEQRASLQARVNALSTERETFVAERARLEDDLKREAERETRIQTLQTELLQLAADREAATKQRDKLRVVRDDLTASLEAVKQHRTRMLAQAAGYEMELTEAHEEQAALRIEIKRLANERSDLSNERARLIAEKLALETDRDQLLARVEGDRARLQQLGADGVGSLTSMIEELSEQRNQLERQLNDAEAKLSELENKLQLMQVNTRTLAGDSPATNVEPTYQPDDPDLVLGMVQELRTPMTSITGYIDLLLGESAGILGEMQRKFLQRVSVNVGRLTGMLDDLVQITQLDTGQFELEPEHVDVVAMIEDAITSASTQFREKGLTVQLDLDDEVPAVPADRDAIGQIIGQLLTNAYLVSPPDSEIYISALRKPFALDRGEHDAEQIDSLYVAVEDRGGGIAPEDEARVFSRKYKAENPLIQGLGDTGVGLSIAKALAEAHGGKLWLETRDNLGSRFVFVLPIMAMSELEGESAEG